MTFAVPLGQKQHQLAEQFASWQSSPQKAQQAYLDTLAVSAVNSYLCSMGFQTDLEGSDSYAPEMPSFVDVPKLEIPNVGLLDCRSVWAGSQVIEIPPEAWAYPIAHVAVQLDKSLQEATLLGFAKTLKPTEEISIKELPVNQLESLEELIKYLTQRQRTINQCNRLATELSDAIALAQECDWEAEEERSCYKINNVIDPAIQRTLGAELFSRGCIMRLEELIILVEECDEDHYLWSVSVYTGERMKETVRSWSGLKTWQVQKALLITLDDIRTGEIFD